MSELSQRLAALTPAKRRLLEQRLQRGAEVAEPIAVVGMACRFAGARSPEAFWKLICEGRDATSEVPPSRWNADEFFDPTGEISGKMSSRWGGFIADVDLFDSMFFGIAPREAKRMDPQQRLLLEVAWEALERGGLAPERIAGSATGVFIGIGGTDYSKVPAQFIDYFEQIDAHVGTGNALSIAANRLSYVLDLHGPSLAIDTACSSGLVGVHLAVQSLRRRECDAALAGGVNLILTPETTIAFSKARMLSPDGRCRPFDAGANGYVRGEGCAIVVLKRLTDAVRDGDHVLAIVRGTAVNQDGRTSGITAPNSGSQRAVIRAALADAGLTPERISYLEAHGTGTPLGDPIEVQALCQLFSKSSPADPPCYMTSVKANIGHTETVSGVAGLIKVVLMLQHGLIPPQTHLATLNPNFSLDGTRLEIPAQAIPWPLEGASRVAGVSSFGFGGTNAHVVVEGASPLEPLPVETERPLHVLTLSAKTETALRTLAADYAGHLSDETLAPGLADVCCTANAGRSHFNHRLAVTASSPKQLRDRLAAFHGGTTPQGAKHGQVRIALRPKVAMLFTGQGSQYVSMGRLLYDTQPVFRRTLNQCDGLLRGQMEEPLLSVIYPEPGRPSPLDSTAYTQPALFALEYSLATLWRSWGIEPDLVLGHSVGEYTAACVAGVFSLEDGLGLIAARARLMQQLPSGGLMAAILAAPGRVAKAIARCQDRVAIAAANGPENTVISGEGAVVRAIVAEFESAGVRTQLLAVSHAFHSPLMEPMLDQFEAVAAAVKYERPRVPIVSNLTGRLLTEERPDAAYWRQHIRSTVQFAAGMETLARQDIHALLEVGPAPVLLGMGRRCIPDFQAVWLPSMRKGRDDWQTLLDSLAELYVLGAKVDWAGFDQPWPRRRVTLPTYPFERTRLWLEGKLGRFGTTTRGPSLHPLLGSRIPSALETSVFEIRLSSASPRYLAEHQVQGSPVVPAAAYVEQGLAAAKQAFGPGRHVVENVSIHNAMFLPPGTARSVQLTLSPERGGECAFETYSIPADSEDAKPHWVMHACGTLRHEDAQQASCGPPAVDLEEVRRRVRDVLTRDQFYRQMTNSGLSYGPAFRVLDDLQRSDRDALAQVRLSPEIVKESAAYQLHPVLLDACIQTVAGIVPLEADGSYSTYTYMPVAVRRLVIHDGLGQVLDLPSDDKLATCPADARRMYTYAARTSADDRPGAEFVEGDVFLLDDKGRAVVELQGVRVQRVGKSTRQTQDVDVRQWLYRTSWQSQPLPRHAGTSGEKAAGETGPPASDSRRGAWLIFADAQGVGAALAGVLQHEGGRCVMVRPDWGATAPAAQPIPAVGAAGPQWQRINPLAADDYRRLFAEASTSDQSGLLGVVHLWSLDTPALDPSSDESLSVARQLGCGSMLQLVKQLARSEMTKPPALWMVTRGGQAVGGEGESVSPAQAALWGMGRVAALEHAEQRCRLVDLDPTAGPLEQAALLGRELVGDPDEDQIAYRGQDRYVARLEPVPDALLNSESAGQVGLVVPPEGRFRLRLGAPGSFDALWFESAAQRQPGPGQVEVQVRAAGLNFSDVLKVLGLYPGIKDETVPLGIECSGVVTAVGEGVKRFKPGDAVLGVAPYSFASHVITAEYALVHKPEDMADDDAATIPITFLTAYYALVRLAQLQPGERVLIHAGAGGVGLAAIQIAQHLGAEVFATAGSDQKREFLRSIGVRHVMNSRTFDFVDDIMQSTDRRGVDVVLNSLPGEAIARSLSVLSAYGRFLEIGKTDIYQNRMIGLLPFQDNLSYFAIDLDRMLRQRPEMIETMFGEVMEHFRQGAYRPLALTRFPAGETVAAFRYMAQRKNTGKVVVSFAERPVREVVQAVSTGPVRADAAYLVTGGLGALGLLVAKWLATQGAKHLVLLSRRAPSDHAAAALEALRGMGVRLAAVQGDVADRRSLADALTQLPADFPPLRGVIHAAGVLDDGLLFNMELPQLDRAMAPKVQGAWNLHEATSGRPLDFFVLFSSVACLLGSPGQANYAAGNAFLDGLAQYRRARGLSATSINWGPWAGSGMAADAGHGDQIQSRGLGLIPTEKGLEVLQRLLGASSGRGTNIAVMDAHWPEIQRAMRGRRPSMLRLVAREEAADPAEPKDSKIDQAFRQQLLAVELEGRKSLLRDYFSGELARIMGIEASNLDVQQPLNNLGLDSLMAIELKNNLEARLAITLPMARFLEGPSVTSLAECAAELVAAGAAEEVGAGQAAAPHAATGAIEHRPPSSAGSAPLVALRRSGTRAPLFLMHAAGGDVRCYYDLARAIEDRPVYSVRARGLDDGQGPHSTLREMAVDYLAALREVQPQGPYHLAGWSAGGVFAYELASLLAEQGTPAASLVLIDTPLPSIFKDVDPNDDARFLYDLVNFSNRAVAANMQVALEELRGLGREERFQFALAEAKRQGVLPAEVSTEYIRRFIEVCRAHVQAIMNYVPPPIGQPLHLFRPAETGVLTEATGQSLANDLGWGTIVSEVVLHLVPGDHFSMLTGDNARRLAAALAECLEGERLHGQ
jgi:acyl transferase domain-containing protein/thioesterase domain-containing protein/acyl carrier protein